MRPRACALHAPCTLSLYMMDIMRIGILQTGRPPEALCAHAMDYPDLFRASLARPGATFTTYRVMDGQMPSGVDAEEGWLVTGSPHGVYEDHAWIPGLEAFVREADRQHVPMVGVCFGHQLIAQALGGKVEKFPGGWVVGPQDYTLDDGSTLTLNAWHQDQVMVPPPQARTIMHSPTCAHAALRYGTHILTVQPHPEFTDTVFRALFHERGHTLPPTIQQAVEQKTTGAPPACQAQFAQLLWHCLSGGQVGTAES
ncbi:type 1 glutamine amidotransferase [Acetobacter suratthaniensis]|uniref:Type 1 glutamine amidotransferase n=1 Tax=Acetobacter suratthaniensis TaxID=1502841 RepID=A0ABS3LJL9_9PROT|nr:type 1 glutamine amidotransferase [Acetobacter suratthaniensis]MCX2566018.1 type 1 glutamine amidotransferase [Acetobacter suratthaniensis]